MQLRLLEPRGEVVIATLACVWRGRRFAFRAARRTAELDMKVLGVTAPGTYLGKPGAISAGLAAQCLLDRGIH